MRPALGLHNLGLHYPSPKKQLNDEVLESSPSRSELAPWRGENRTFRENVPWKAPL